MNEKILLTRNNGIDTLRGLSILLVMLFHCHLHMPFINDFLPQKLFTIIFSSGYYGVIIFFVISGFLITSVSFKRFGDLKNISFGKFYRMRFARIMPCLIILLAILSILDILGISGFTINTTSLSQALYSALTFQINWLEGKTGYLPANWDILWSLSIEECFYLLFPLFCLVFRKPTYFAFAMLGFVILGPFARVAFTNNEIWADHSYLSCMDGIAIGCISALISHSIKFNKKQLFLIISIGIVLFSFIFILRKQAYDTGISKIGLNITLLEISIGLILIGVQEWSVKEKNSGGLWNAALRWLGRNSYEIYLIHSFFIIAMANILFNTKTSPLFTLVYYAIAIILSGVASQAISSYFSEPMNHIIRSKRPIASDQLVKYQANRTN